MIFVRCNTVVLFFLGQVILAFNMEAFSNGTFSNSNSDASFVDIFSSYLNRCAITVYRQAFIID